MKRMSTARKRALTSARGVVKRLMNNMEYAIDESFYKSLTSMSTQKLKTITRRNLIRNKVATFIFSMPDDTEEQREKKISAAKSKRKAIRPRKTTTTGSHTGRSGRGTVNSKSPNIKILTIGHSEFDSVMKILREGASYAGQYSKKSNGESAFVYVQKSAGRIEHIMNSAVSKMMEDFNLSRVDAEKEIMRILKDWQGGLEKLKDTLYNLVYAVYDDVYAEWAEGYDAYEYTLSLMAAFIGGEDLKFI